jgi:S-adenosylmethionine:tRNA ribosyltransferase-isomerase
LIMQRDFNRIDTFDYSLPEELIAKKPLAERTDSRLLHCTVADNALHDMHFNDLVEWLQPGDVLVLNNTKVIPARFFGQKQSGGRIEGLLERIVDPQTALVHLKSSKSPKAGTILELEGGYDIEVVGRDEDLFECVIRASKDGEPLSWLEYTDRHGHIPLPPYIDRADQEEDRERYQCVFHDPDAPGAVAAPTAGLHINETFLAAIQAKGVQVTYVTLHVGAGTFQPVRVDSLDKHIMHSEWCSVSKETAELINDTKQNNKGRVVAVGTTSVRTLESSVDDKGLLTACEGHTNLFIRPGFKFKVIDALITNFHLPKSTLLVLICALGGYDFMMQAYRHAVVEKYRFFSYGDAMLIEGK